jgi:hypothetical protein
MWLGPPCVLEWESLGKFRLPCPVRSLCYRYLCKKVHPNLLTAPAPGIGNSEAEVREFRLILVIAKRYRDCFRVARQGYSPRFSQAHRVIFDACEFDIWGVS